MRISPAGRALWLICCFAYRPAAATGQGIAPELRREKLHRADSAPLVPHPYNEVMNEKRKTTRRQFLKGRAAVEALGDLAAGPADGSLGRSPPPPRPPGSYLMHIARPAMACEFAVFLNAGQYHTGPDAALKALDLVETLEDQLTVYRDHSEVSRINRLAAKEPLPVEARLFALLQQAVQLHRETDGAFDITSTPLTKVWGFFRREGRIPQDEDLAGALARVGSRWIELDPQQHSIHFLKPDLELNLGAIGKGYALDCCAQLMAREEIDSFLIHGGQSSVLARGSRESGEVEQRCGWNVSLRHPLRPERKLADFWLRDQSLGTSGSAAQSFHYQGKRLGHILDPRTGRPAENVLSSTVVTESAALSDALATAFYVMGAEAALAYCRDRPHIATMIVTAGRRAGGIDIHTANLPDDNWACYEGGV
jgi:FAD:protein FMN transferase